MRKFWTLCCNSWYCSPRFFQWFVVFWVANILGDLIAFPFVHTFWNILNFEGWYLDE